MNQISNFIDNNFIKCSIVAALITFLVVSSMHSRERVFKTDYDYYEIEIESNNPHLFLTDSKMRYDQGWINIAAYDGVGNLAAIKLNPRFPILIHARVEFVAKVANTTRPEMVTFKARRGGAGVWQLQKTLLITPESPYVVLQGGMSSCGTLYQ